MLQFATRIILLGLLLAVAFDGTLPNAAAAPSGQSLTEKGYAAPTVSSKNKTKPQIRLNAAKEANPLLAEEKAKKQEEEDQLKAAEMVEEQKAKLIEEEKRAKEAEEANRLMAEEKARKEEEDKANEVKKVTKMPKLLQLKRSESPKFDTQVTEGSSGTIIEKNNNIEEVKEHLKDLLNNKQVPGARRVNTI